MFAICKLRENRIRVGHFFCEEEGEEGSYKAEPWATRLTATSLARPWQERAVEVRGSLLAPEKKSGVDRGGG